MKFVNDGEVPRKFTLRGVEYVVKPGDEVEVPDKLGYAVELMKLPLRCTSGPVEDAEKQDEPETLEVWRERALTARRRAESAEAQVRRLNDRLSEEQDAKAKLLSAQGADETRLREDLAAFKTQVVELQGQLAAVTKDRDELLEQATKVDDKKPIQGTLDTAGKPAKSAPKPS